MSEALKRRLAALERKVTGPLRELRRRAEDLLSRAEVAEDDKEAAAMFLRYCELEQQIPRVYEHDSEVEQMTLEELQAELFDRDRVPTRHQLIAERCINAMTIEQLERMHHIHSAGYHARF